MLFVVTLTFAGRRFSTLGIQRLSLIVAAILLVLFAGMRDRSVGTDTGNYVYMLGTMGDFEDIFRSTEIGYNALTVGSATVSNNYAALLVAIALIVVFCYMATIVRLTRNRELALLIFVAFGTYTFFFNGARQGIAAAICFAALPSLLNRRVLTYLLMISAATLFHHSALIAAPLYFLASRRAGWQQIGIVAVGAVALVVFLEAFVALAARLVNDRYAAYASGEGGGEVLAAFLCLQGLILLSLKKRVSDVNGYYGRLLNIYLLGLVPVIASTISNVNPSGLLRLHIYFTHTAIILWPIAISCLWHTLLKRNIGIQGLASVGFFVVAIAFYFLSTSTFSSLAPYRLNPSFIW